MAQQHHGNTNYGMVQQPSQPSRGPMGSQETLLLIYVVDYCEKRGYNESAAVLRKEGRLQQDTKPPTDSKEGLLYEWWICFWDIYTARVHPEKSTSSKAAKLYAESLHHPQFGRPRDGGQPSNVRIGGGPPPPGSAAHSASGVNGQGPSGASYGTNPSGMNSVQPPPTTSGAMSGMPAANPSMLNPALHHLQQQRIPGYSAQGPGTQMQPVYIQRPPGTQGPAGAPMGAMGQMGQMGQPQQRMHNGVLYAQNPNYRPQPGQQSPQQQQEMQTTGASGSPKQLGAPSTAQNSSPHLQGANGNAYDPSGMEQGTRNQPSRGQKRPSPAEDDQYSKDASPPDRKKLKKSPQENGPALPTTPSLASAQPQPGNGRPPMQTGAFNGMPPNKPNSMMGGVPFPAQIMTNGPPLGAPGMQQAMAGQLREGTQAHLQHTQRASGATPHQTHQTDQQYFTQMQQTAITTYNINKPYPSPQNPTLTGPPGVAAEPAVRGATNAPKGSMLPPPPPNPSTGQSAPGTGNSTPGKNTSVMSGLQPRNAGNKESLSPREGVSPESARPGSRPGSTPQMTSAPIPGTGSTPGGPSAISAPSPSHMTTPQQISRPQTQSPSQAALARPSSAATNGLPGSSGPPLNPSAMLARYGGGAPPSGTNGAAGGVQAGSTPSNAGMGDSTDMLVGGPLTNDLFMSLSNNGPFDLQMQMMGYQDDPFTTNMGLDFGTNFGMDESYNNMSMYINDSSLDNGA